MRIVLATIVAGVCLFASANSSINELMRDVGDTMLRMLPAVYDEKPDRTLLMENLVRLEYLFNEARPHFESRPVGSQVTFDLIDRRFDEAIALGERRNIDLLRRSVAEAFELCAACHTQDGVTRRAFGVSKIRELDEYMAVEFSYLTRDYASARTSIDNYLAGDTRTFERDLVVLQRLLSIGAEVHADPALAARQLREVVPRLDGRLRARVSDWIDVLDRIGDEAGELQSPFTYNDIASINRFLSNEWPAIKASLDVDEQEAYWVTIRGVLSKLLATRATSDEVPRLLYWFAVSDRALHYRYYNSLSTAYLERCIEEHSNHPFAKRCLEEYEFLVLINFSGSGGTRVPPEVRDRLTELQRRVYE
ncbi:MAG: hypothetical protein U5O39_15965 [Gammaproteobacteria bacterium]|nr:hypothetical protein [Gammaproteobacteria bacterium]